MLSPKRFTVSVLVALAVLGSVSTLEAKEAKGVRAVDGTAQTKVVRGQTFTGLGTCTLGANFAPAWALDYFFPPGDKYFTLIDPGQCVNCPDTTNITAAHILLFFQAPCNQSVSVSLVGVSADDPSCAMPDTNNVIMGPVDYTLDGSTINTTIDFMLPFPEAVCITDSVFLQFTINPFEAACSSQLTVPLLITAGSGCTTCKYWNIYDNGNSQDDLCVVLPIEMVDGPPVHYVDTDCTCQVVPTLPTSWGSLKIRYANP